MMKKLDRFVKPFQKTHMKSIVIRTFYSELDWSYLTTTKLIVAFVWPLTHFIVLPITSHRGLYNGTEFICLGPNDSIDRRYRVYNGKIDNTIIIITFVVLFVAGCVSYPTKDTSL